LALACTGNANAQTPDTPPPTPRFALQVQAPEPTRSWLEKHLDILRFQQLPDLDAGELQRLVDQVPADVGQLLGAQGYFSPAMQAVLAPPGDSGPPLGVLNLSVEPGPLATVASVALSVRPPAQNQSEAPEGSDALAARLRAAWSLREGQPFTQTAWSEAKSSALRALTQQDHPEAQLVGSLADVDAENNQVHLSLEFDPGPAFTFGPVVIEGLQRYDAAWVENMVAFAGAKAGTPYRLNALQTAQQLLAQSGYFESVFVYVDPNDTHNASPVRVKVREARRGKLVFGVGGSTDNGARLSAEHTWRQIPGLNWRAHSTLRLERDTRTAETELNSPMRADGWHWVFGAKADRQLDGTATTTSQQVRLGQAQDSDTQDRSLFAQFDRSLVRNPLLPATLTTPASQSISANWAWTRRRFDQMPFPQSGHGLAAEIGLGLTTSPSVAPYLRTRARWQGLWSLPGERTGRVVFRAEAGAVVAKDDTPVPDSQRFLTGGDQTVRGYGLRDIGVVQSDGSVSPGRLVTVGSLEWQRPIWRGHTRTAWESTLFIDAGSVADRASQLQAKVGVGAGVRYNSPVGPLQMDLAYGVATRRFRLHLSVGFSF
jgi:translocation and assembly module TamA